MSRAQIKAGFLAVILALGWIVPADAAPTITLSPTVNNTPNIGKVVESNPTSTAVFRVDASTGSVTRTSGTLIRIGAGTVTVPNYTVTCVGGNGSGNRCGTGLSSLTVTVAAGSGSASAVISAINVSVTNGPGTTTCSAANQNTATVTITCSNITSVGNNVSETVATIKVGMDIKVQAALPSAAQTLTYTVTTNP